MPIAYAAMMTLSKEIKTKQVRSISWTLDFRK